MPIKIGLTWVSLYLNYLLPLSHYTSYCVDGVGCGVTHHLGNLGLWLGLEWDLKFELRLVNNTIVIQIGCFGNKMSIKCNAKW